MVCAGDAWAGANLQHYNPLIDEEVKKCFELPEHWILNAQMVFGTPVKEPGGEGAEGANDGEVDC